MSALALDASNKVQIHVSIGLLRIKSASLLARISAVIVKRSTSRSTSRSICTLPGWDANPQPGYPQAFIHLARKRHCESKVSCLGTQHNVPGQG